MNKERMFYWLTVLPLAGMLIYLHGEYKDREAIIKRMHKLNNRQLEVMAASYTELLNQQSIRQMIEIGKIEQHHREEVAEVMEFYETELNGSKND